MKIEWCHLLISKRWRKYNFNCLYTDIVFESYLGNEIIWLLPKWPKLKLEFIIQLFLSGIWVLVSVSLSLNGQVTKISQKSATLRTLGNFHIAGNFVYNMRRFITISGKESINVKITTAVIYASWFTFMGLQRWQQE